MAGPLAGTDIHHNRKEHLYKLYSFNHYLFNYLIYLYTPLYTLHNQLCERFLRYGLPFGQPKTTIFHHISICLLFEN